MPVDIYATHPKSIRTVKEAEDILSRLTKYERERSCKAGILETQNRVLGGSYFIKSEEEAQGQLSMPVTDQTAEWGIKFYPRSFFEDLRDRLIKTQ